MEKKKGFTLVELLVVIAIIALLMSIMMPALSRVKRQARTVLCLSQLKQFGLIYQMYTQDNNGQFHSHQRANSTNGLKYDRTWYRMFVPYYQNKKIRLCPEAKKNLNDGGQNPFAALGYNVTNPDDPLYGTNSDSSYGENFFCTNPVSTGDNARFSLSMNFKGINVRGASNIPLFGDCTYVGGWVTHYDPTPLMETEHPAGSSMKRFCINRHTQTANLLFVDFSVRNNPMKKYYTFKWNRDFDTTTQPVWEPWMNGFKE